MSHTMIGYAGIIVMLILLALGFPIYLSLTLVGVLGLIWIQGLAPALANLAALPFQWTSNWVLVTIPLYIAMGYFTFHSGISRSLYDTAYKFIGHFPGGLAMATTAACTAFGAVCGSSVANAGAMGAIAIPEMYRHDYDKSMAAGTVAAGGTIGTMMPPSAGFIIMGAITGQSIIALFIAGILPALLMMVVFWATTFIIVKRNPKLAPPVRPFTWRERLLALGGVGPVVFIFFVVMGGMYGGFFTATEGGAFGALATFLLFLLRGQLNRRNLFSSLVDTATTTCMIFLIFIGAGIFGNFLALTRLPIDFAEWLVSLPIPGEVIVVLILAAYLPMGSFMDALSAIMITLPIFYPVVELLGFNLIWFVVLVEVMGEIGCMTPPVAVNVFVLKGVSGLPLEKIFRGVMPFVWADIVVAILIFLFPQICLWLPAMGRYR